MDVEDWLRRLGLERYEAAFRENEIDETVLPNLTAEDLKDLGACAIGRIDAFAEAMDMRNCIKKFGALDEWAAAAERFADRVQALAEPGAVLVTTRVQRQIAGLFVAEDRGTYSLKGVPEPTVLFRGVTTDIDRRGWLGRRANTDPARVIPRSR
jgi:SAM (Sterile alpha motif) domain-containing protein